jgi:AraC-like DNA-binding protein
MFANRPMGARLASGVSTLVMTFRDISTETGLSVTEIAAELGYSAPANFARAFRKATGSPPHSFRSASRSPCDPARG